MDTNGQVTRRARRGNNHGTLTELFQLSDLCWDRMLQIIADNP